MRGAVLGVGDRVGAARARLHVLLRRGRGVARRRADGDRLHGQPRDGVRPRRRSCGGVAMLGGLGARRRDRPATNLGVPFLIRAGVLVVMFVVAALLMHDLGFTPERGENPLQATRTRVPRVDRRTGSATRRCAGSCSRRRSRPASASTSSTRCSRTCSSCGATTEAYTIAGLAAAILVGCARSLGGCARAVGAPAVPPAHDRDPARDGRRARIVLSARARPQLLGRDRAAGRVGHRSRRSTTRCTGRTSTT